jgi:hypothetical protein
MGERAEWIDGCGGNATAGALIPGDGFAALVLLIVGGFASR